MGTLFFYYSSGYWIQNSCLSEELVAVKKAGIYYTKSRHIDCTAGLIVKQPQLNPSGCDSDTCSLRPEAQRIAKSRCKGLVLVLKTFRDTVSQGIDLNTLTLINNAKTVIKISNQN